MGTRVGACDSSLKDLTQTQDLGHIKMYSVIPSPYYHAQLYTSAVSELFAMTPPRPKQNNKLIEQQTA